MAATLVLRTIKGTPLTNYEVDNNFSNLNVFTSLVDSNVGVLTNLTTTAKGNIVVALNEIMSSLPIAAITSGTIANVTVSNVTITSGTFTGNTINVATRITLPSGTTAERPGTPSAGDIRFNSDLVTYEGYNGTTWGSIGAGGLNPTAIKTSNYTAATNDLVRCDSTAGAFSITLPASPTDGDIIGLVDIAETFGTYAVSVLPNTGKTIEGDSTSLILDMNGAYVSFVYNSATTNWRLLETPVGILGDVSTTGTQTLINKTINLANNTISGTLTQFNTAVSDADLVSLTGAETLTNKTITVVSLKETKVAMAADDIDLSLANYYSKTISGSTTLTVSNVPASGTSASFILDLTDGGSATITWWSGVKWVSGTAPTLTSSGRDTLGFFTYDGGTTWTGLVLGKDIK